VFTPKNDRTLQQLAAAALLVKNKPTDRYELLNQQSTEFRCIGAHKTVDDYLCGYLTSFERGAPQPVIGDDAKATALRLSALSPPPPQKGGVQQQYVPGVVYFVIYQNHVAVVQSAAMHATAVEKHLHWLLKERTSQLETTVSMALSDEAQKATKEKIKRSHVKSIALGQPLMSEVAPLPLAGTDRSHVEAKSRSKKHPPKKFKPSGRVLDFLKSYFVDSNSFEKLGLNEVFDGNIEVWIEIRFPKRKRSKAEDVMQLMDTLGVALRDIEGDQVALKLADGTKVAGSELKISAKLDVSRYLRTTFRTKLSSGMKWLPGLGNR
jgi:hypothetical protein